MIAYCSLEQAAELDAFVTTHPRGHYMQTSWYGRSRTDYHWDGIVLKNQDNQIVATMALHSRPVRFFHKKLFYAPRGPVFSTMEAFRQIIDAAVAFARKQGGYLLRIDPIMEQNDDLFCREAQRMGFRIDPRSDYSTFQPRCIYLTDLENRTESELLDCFHSKTRYNIRLAQRRGVTVREGTRDDLAVFQTMMEQTAQRDGFSPRSLSFYDQFLDAMGERAVLLLAEKDGQVLAGVIEVILGTKAWYAYGCSFLESRADMPNYLLQWEMIRRALAHGCTQFDFRGVEGQSDPDNPHYGLHRFKQGFDARFVSFAGQMDLTLRPVSKWVIDRAQALYQLLPHT